MQGMRDEILLHTYIFSFLQRFHGNCVWRPLGCVTDLLQLNNQYDMKKHEIEKNTSVEKQCSQKYYSANLIYGGDVHMDDWRDDLGDNSSSHVVATFFFRVPG